jgi:DNA-binding NtrC family response regulator
MTVMLNVLLVTNDRESWKEFTGFLAREGVNLDQADSGQSALEMAEKGNYALMIADENIEDYPPLKLVSDLLKVNPMINTAVVSNLSEHDFHEASEGLGILLQLPVHPGKDEAALVVARTRRVMGLSS